jgi:hypothetical protein
MFINRLRYTCLVFFSIYVVMSCKKPYNPPANTNNVSYLVVEGVINSGADSTTIRLSHTVLLSGNTSTKPELNATVAVESDANNTYQLTEAGSGQYVYPGLNLDITHKYRLRIKTTANKQYVSDFVEVKVTPPIDSIGFTVTNTGIQVYSNAHDPNNNTRSYRWDYRETWNFHALYDSKYVSDGTAIQGRLKQIYSCFTSDSSTSIVLGSSAKLANDVINQNPVTTIASTSEKIEAKYSILLHQYALTSDAYSFWLNLQKNTEQLGSIFDAQPSSVSGNIHNVEDSSEPVIGYISASTVQSKRIFISKLQLPGEWVASYPYSCGVDTEYYKRPGTDPIINDVQLYLLTDPPNAYPVDEFFLPGNHTPFPDGFTASDVQCMDCTIRGTTTAPAFWK